MEDEAFEWDDDKARINLAKHQIDFEDAKLVFADPGWLDDPDETMDYGEERYRAIGFARGHLITVFYTLRGRRRRIISARRSSRAERLEYARENPTV